MPCWKLADVVLLPGGRNWKLMLVWYCCLVVETGSWGWFGAAAWWCKLMLNWCCCLVVEADADLVLLIVAWISRRLAVDHWEQVPGSLWGCRSLKQMIGSARRLSRGCLVCWFCWFLLILLIAPSLGESPGYGVDMTNWQPSQFGLAGNSGHRCDKGSPEVVFSTSWSSFFTISQKNVYQFSKFPVVCRMYFLVEISQF